MSTQATAISAQHRQASGFSDPRSVGGWIFSAFTRLCHGIAARRQARRDIRELRSLSNETLRDIGVSRSEIVSLVLDKHYGLVDRRNVRF